VVLAGPAWYRQVQFRAIRASAWWPIAKIGVELGEERGLVVGGHVDGLAAQREGAQLPADLDRERGEGEPAPGRVPCRGILPGVDAVGGIARETEPAARQPVLVEHDGGREREAAWRATDVELE